MGIYKVNKTYYVRFRNPETGKVKRASTGVGDKKLALAIDGDIKARIAKKQFLGLVEPERVVFDKLCDQFLAFSSQRNRPKTVLRNRASIQHLRRFFHGRYIADISHQDVDNYMSARLQEGVKPRSVNIEFMTLRFMLDKAVDWGFLAVNPVIRVRQLKVEPRPMQVLTAEQELRLRAECRPLLRLIVMTGLNSGLRKGELQQLCWSNINLPGRYMLIVGTKVHKNRQVPISDTLLEVLLQLKAQATSDYVFAKADGSPYGNFEIGFKAACRRAGIVGFRIHDLRSTFASRFVQAGGSIVALQHILGHTDIRMTERYTRLFQTHLLSEIRKMDQSTNKAYPLPELETTPKKS